MSAIGYIAAGAVGLPILVILGTAACGLIASGISRLGGRLGLDDEAALYLGGIGWFMVSGAVFGAWVWWGAAA